MPNSPDLPPVYEPVPWEGETTVLEETARRARGGSPEGTLVWSTRPELGEGRLGQSWHPPLEGLFCGLVLRPEDPLPTAAQTSLVALVALGITVAEQVQPLTHLRYRWPNDLLLNQRKAATVALRAGEESKSGDCWLVLGLNVNLSGPPYPEALRSTSLAEEGGTQARASELLEGFGRHFLVWINRWAKGEFGAVRRAWHQRAIEPKELVRVALPRWIAEGRGVELSCEGGLILEKGEGTHRTISLVEAYGLSESLGASL